MKQIDLILAEKLLKINAINLQPDNPFTWASGWSAPIYSDIRRALSYPAIRTFIKVEFTRLIMEHFGFVDAIAGVSTGAIAHGALVADELMLPYVYVRPEPKDHGLENIIEGNLNPGQKVVVVEDIISTGANSLHAMQAIRGAGCRVVGVVTAFDYQFPDTPEKFKKAHVPVISLTNYAAMIKEALRTEYIRPEDVESLDLWRKDPENWLPAGTDI